MGFLTFKHGFFLGGLVCAILSGRPSPASPMSKLIAYLSNLPGDEHPKLHYFDIRGRAEAIRIALADQGLEYEDSSFSSEEWGRDSPDGLKASWTAEKKLMFGQVPMLEDPSNGLFLVQSHAILRYLAATHGWYEDVEPKTLALADAAAEGTEDMRKQLTTIKYDNALSAEEKEGKYEAWFEDPSKGGTWFSFFEALLPSPDGSASAEQASYLAGAQTPTHADYLLFDLLEAAEGLHPTAATKLMASFKALPVWRTTMASRPNIAAYLESTKRRAA